ncbi:MAG: amino acid ABC transporter permease [Motilibacteraceae bacterium]
MSHTLLGWTQYLPDLLSGLRVALLLTAVSLLLGYPLGLLLAVATSSPLRWLRGLALVVVEVGRGLPLLVLLYIVYQGLPQLSVTPTAMVSAVAAFTWSAAAYSTEILRASLGAVPTGQTEAATAAGMHARDTFRFVVLPQAGRLAVPPLLNLAVQMFQITSLAYVITVPEVMQSAYFAGTVSFDYLSVFLAAAVVYAVITLPASALVSRLEGRLSRHL